MADYQINIPGITQIIRFKRPEEELTDEKRERIARMRAAQSPVPGFLQWIPPAITAIDNAQDLLYVGLTLAKPLLRRLPARFLPGLGWALFANDVMNVANAILSSYRPGVNMKRVGQETLNIFTVNRASRILRAKSFLASTPLLPFALQAGQVAYDMTGYGLCLGPLFGAVADTEWSIIRALEGKSTQIRLPPPDDPLGKAARYLMQSGVRRVVPDAFSKEDHERMIAAESVAMQIIEEEGDHNKLDYRGPSLLNENVPVYLPSVEQSNRALELEGFPPYERYANVAALGVRDVTAADTIRTFARFQDAYNNYMGGLFKSDLDRGRIMQMIANEAGHAVWRFGAGGLEGLSYIMFPAEQMFLRLLESDIQLRTKPDTPGMIKILNHAYIIANHGDKRREYEPCLEEAFTAWFYYSVANQRWAPYNNLPLRRPYAGPAPRHSLPIRDAMLGISNQKPCLWLKSGDDALEAAGKSRLFPRSFPYGNLCVF